MTRGALVASMGLLLLTLIVGAGNLIATYQAVNHSQHQWCSTLDLLTSRQVARPADPKANQSRENAYIFYTNLVKLRRNFGCG